MDIMLNEHHQTATCINTCAPLSAAILARQTSKGRICILGNPVANRGDPLRIAEEMAMIDCISRGRLSAVVLKAEERLGKDLGIHALGDGDLGTVGTNEQLQALCEVVGAQGLIV